MKTNKDLIDRQAAIDICNFAIDLWRGQLGEGIVIAVRKRIEQLPAVQSQPGIIRCKDCKYRMPYDWMFSEIWRSQNIDDYTEDEIGCQYCDMAMKADDFCSRAERRTDE